MMKPAKVDAAMRVILRAHWQRYVALMRWELIHDNRGNQHSANWRKQLFDERHKVSLAYIEDCVAAGVSEYDRAQHADRLHRASLDKFGPIKTGLEILASLAEKAAKAA